MAVVAPSPEERAAKLGFVRHLPQDTEVVMSFYHGARNLSHLRNSKLGRVFQEQAGLPPGMDAGENVPATGPAAMFEKEFTIALGKTAGEQTGHLLTLNRRMGFFQMRDLVRNLAESARTGDDAMLQQGMNRYNMELMTDLLADPETGVALLERLKMPPMYLAFRTAPETLDSTAQQLAQLTEFLGMLGDVVEPVEVEKSGRPFAGYKISGVKVSKSVAAGRAELDQILEPGMVDRLLAAIAKRDLVALSGTLGDYAILFLGSSADDLAFAPSSGESLAGGDALAFCDAHLSKDLAVMIHGGKEPIRRMADAASGFSDMVSGLREGLAAAEGLGDTRDLEALLQLVAGRETALRALASTEATGTAVFLEDGVKIESYGGTDAGALDWIASNKLAALGNSDNVALFANMTGDADYDGKARAWFEALTETAYALAMKVSELPLKDADMHRFKEMAALFDKKFSLDALALWETFSGDFNAGLGGERALVVDLNGAAPTIPGLPQALVDEAKFPRITLVAPVADKARLSSAWGKMNRSATSILAKIGEMNGEEIPMPKPISSERNGYLSWFFPLPFFNDDFVPSVTLGDEWFAASTSKNQALDLLSKAGKGEARQGLWMSVDFQALRKFADESLDLLEKHPDAVALDDGDREMIRNLADAMENLEKLTVHSRKEAGVLRTSIHLKTR